jgi:hypothetical protein
MPHRTRLLAVRLGHAHQPDRSGSAHSVVQSSRSAPLCLDHMLTGSDGLGQPAGRHETSSTLSIDVAEGSVSSPRWRENVRYPSAGLDRVPSGVLASP